MDYQRVEVNFVPTTVPTILYLRRVLISNFSNFSFIFRENKFQSPQKPTKFIRIDHTYVFQFQIIHYSIDWTAEYGGEMYIRLVIRMVIRVSWSAGQPIGLSFGFPVNSQNRFNPISTS